ncbi:MAG TPA: ABC transporter substrate-binding protein [Burkholderiales bacterium]|nr:ABC transporter substrate-binding protein [Burkholderiales bacterium]
MKHRIAAVLLSTGALLAGFCWAGESWAQTKIARVGILTFVPRTDDPTLNQWFEPFRRTLSEQGWIEGTNISFEYRSVPSGEPSQLAKAAAELVRLKVDVIWASGAPFARAAYEATHTIPIVAQDFTTDPVTEGYVESYGRPGGNLTGVFLDAPEFAGKWFQLLKAMVPRLSGVVVLWDPSPGAVHLQAVKKLAGSFRVQLQVVEVRKPDDIDRAFSALRGRPQGVIILPSPMIYVQSARLAKLAMKHRLLATSMARAFADAGGAMSYGPELASASERSAIFVAKIFGGAKPAELPVERPTKVQLVVNLRAAKALGLTVPESVLYRADEVIR